MEPSIEQMISETAPQSAEPAAPAAAEGQTPEAAQPTPQEFEYVIEGGKKIKEPLEMVLKRAGMGYHYAQRMHELSLKDEKYKGYDQKLAELQRWQEYNDFAAKNPDWAKHVEEAWNNRSNLQQSNGELNSDPNNPLFAEVQSLKSELAEFKQFRDELTTKQQEAMFKEQDTKFDTEIATVSKQYGVDLSQSDEQGRSLEWRVLEHMKAMGLDGSRDGHFRAAFKDYYFDNLVERTKESAKEQLAKEQEEMRKAGILGVSRTPKSSRSFNPASTSYNDLANMALAELQAKKA